MNRLQSELHRLYLPLPGAAAPGGVRALVMGLAKPPSWESLARVWRGAQSELGLPAPAIAVSGSDALQLWFSLAQPVTLDLGQRFLEGLRLRYLPELEPGRFGLLAGPEAAAMHPAQEPATGNWSAFVAPDLAPIFDDTPWLDIPPNEEGQATLLQGLATIQADEFQAALAKLSPSASAVAGVAPQVSEPRPAEADPQRFLLRVMNDDSVAMALRIEAAKALLPYPAPWDSSRSR